MFPTSIRWRLQIWLGLLLLLVVGGFGIAVFQLERANDLNRLDREIEERVRLLNLSVRSSPGPPRRRPSAPPDEFEIEFDETARRPTPPEHREFVLSAEAKSLLNEQPSVTYFAAWTPEGDWLGRSENAPEELDPPESIGRDTSLQRRTRDQFREGYQFTELGDCVLVGTSLRAHSEALQRLGWKLAGISAALLALGLGGGWWLTTRAIRPVEEIDKAASRISADNLSERIQVSDADNEIGRLAGVLNGTFDRLEAAVARQKQFSADAAHELRTPLAVIIAESQATLKRERTAEEYRETVESNLATAQEMRDLANTLLDLERNSEIDEAPIREPIDLAEAAAICIESAASIAEDRRIAIDSSLSKSVCLGNAEQIAQVIGNLLSNAIHYNHDGGRITVGTHREDEWAVLWISNTGPGISEEDLPRIFDRFFRADSSRSRTNGVNGVNGFGLGLAISKSLVESHGGRIEAKCENKLVTFEVYLPAAD